MSIGDFFDGTELVRILIHKKNESVLKLKRTMIRYSVRRGTKRYERCRYILQFMGMVGKNTRNRIVRPINFKLFRLRKCTKTP